MDWDGTKPTTSETMALAIPRPVWERDTQYDNGISEPKQCFSQYTDTAIGQKVCTASELGRASVSSADQLFSDWRNLLYTGFSAFLLSPHIHLSL